MKSKGPVVLIVLAGLVVAALVAVALFPKLVTGDIYTVTFDSISISPEGRARLEYRDRQTVLTRVEIWMSPNSVLYLDAPMHFPAWPIKDDGVYECSLLSRTELHSEISDVTGLEKRILVEKGKTYVLHKGERLMVYRTPEGDGKPTEGYFVVTP